MSFFQNAVLNKYLKTLNPGLVQNAYKKFTAYFHNSDIQNNIREAKEEQFQEGFLRELFVNIFGYTINPEPNFNLTTEFKNLTGSKKADGAILTEGKAIAVIELKGTDTRHLDSINEQAFNYKNNQTDCIYVITSNFEKLRFYIHNSVDHLEFNLFTLTENEFQLLWLCLAAECLLRGIPAKVKEESLLEEENITKYLYKDYANFRTDLWQNMVLNNPQVNQLILFRKTQKLLDRILFVFFAEDSGLLPPNSISRMVERWLVLKDEDAYKPLYDIFKQFFGYINTGRKGKTDNDDIFAYNGGLFIADEILDTIRIDDEVLQKHTMKLSTYNFQSEVDVNILGHIFENSLNEIENVKAQIEGQETDKSKSKRKKDGIFYTPRYITKYIVENTIGKLCTEKKADLNIIDEEYAKGRRNRKKETIHKLDDQLKAYREWLLNITICDPACGSGAFLNQALEFLIEEHQYIDELQAQLLGSSFIFPDVENHILEKNIFGVDINDESVEIARLSLWLRTAQRGRKLTSLNNNIKCGNSLIDDLAVADDKAFNWPNEFPGVFAQGGFDVVIGNPPYVFGGNEGISNNEKKYFKQKYKTGNGKVNLFTLFIEQSYNILKNLGEFSFIIPNTFLRVTSYHESRMFFVDNFCLRELADLGADVFHGAVTTAIILVASKNKPNDKSEIKIIKDFKGDFSFLKLSDIKKNNYIISSNTSDDKSSLIQKIIANSDSLGNECKEMIFGVVITKNKDEVVSEVQIENYKPFLEGKDIASYLIKPIHQYLNYYPPLLHRARTKEVFEVPEKLLVQRITGGKTPLRVAYDNFGYYNKESINNIILKTDSKYNPKFILTLLNSTLINWFYNNQFTNESTLTVNISKEYLSRIPIKLPNSQQSFIEKADLMLSLNKELQSLSNKFSTYFSGKYKIDKLSNKLENWYELEFPGFISELNKAIKTNKGTPLTKKDEFEWIDLFNENKQKALALKSEIEKTDKEIDLMVYELYGLTEEEIKIVEGK